MIRNEMLIVAGSVLLLGSVGCSGRVVSSAAPSPQQEAGADASHHSPNGAKDAGHDAASAPDADASVPVGCDVSGIEGLATCCHGKVCRGECGEMQSCECGEVSNNAGGCPANSICCEDSMFCTSEAVCNGTFDPNSETLAPGSPDGIHGAGPVSVCAGKKCIGRCVLDDQGHEHCSCWGIDGGCPYPMRCCPYQGSTPPGCGEICGVLPPK